MDQIITWLSDPAHIVVVASVVSAIVPTPAPDTNLGKLYHIVDLLAVNVLHAKDKGTTNA